VLTAAGVTFPNVASAQATGAGTLKIITWVNPPAVAALTKIDSEFEKANPGIKVQLETAANVTAGYATLFQTTVDANTADIVTNVSQVQPLPLNPTRANMSPTQYFTTSGVFLPLNNQPWIKDFTPAALGLGTYKGQIDGLVSGVYQQAVFYNKADFAKYHLTVPTTWDQFMTLLKTLAADHVTPVWLGAGGGASIYVQNFITEALMASLWLPHAPGANIYTDLQTGATTWDNPYFVQAMTDEVTIGKYIEPDYAGVPWLGMPSAFGANKAPMLLDGSWDLSVVHQDNPNLQVGAFPLPGSNIASQNQTLLKPDLTFMVMKHAHNMAAALKYMAFFASKPIYEQYVDITGISPSETSGTYTSFSSKVLGSWLGKGISMWNVMPPSLPVTEGYYDTNVEFPLLQEAVMAGTVTPQTAAKEIQSSWKR
jgi:raffinose/stachyose/melibiose transport system substrate-binding protein